MDAIVIYNSKRGSTELYAGWIAESLGCEAVKLDRLDKSGGFTDAEGLAANISDFECIVFGSWLRGSGIVGYNEFSSISAGLEARIILFAVGVSEYTPQNYMQICRINFPAADEADMSGLKLFYCHGAYKPDAVRGLDRIMMALARRIIKSGRTADDAAATDRLIDAIENGADFTDRKYADCIVRAAEEMLGS